jgi:hypothetical protein
MLSQPYVRLLGSGPVACLYVSSDVPSHHRHKHQGLDRLIRSVSRVTTVLANVSSVFQLLFFLVVCSDMISKGFRLVAFFASVKASSVCIYLSCLLCIQSVVHGVRSRLFCGHKGCNLPEVSITSFLPLQFFVSVRLSESNFLTVSCRQCLSRLGNCQLLKEALALRRQCVPDYLTTWHLAEGCDLSSNFKYLFFLIS